MSKLFTLIILLFLPLILIADENQKYTLSTGDEIRIQVHRQSDLTLEIRLDDDGIISYPFLGEIKVKGLSLGEIEEKIRNGLHPDYIINPDVNVSIIQYRPIFINGQVNRPGAYPFQPGLTVQQAVSLAGGFTERAAQDKIYIIRKPSKNKRRVKKATYVQPDDNLIIEESFF